MLLTVTLCIFIFIAEGPSLGGTADLNTTGAVTLDFSSQFPFILILSNATLTLKNIILTGVYTKYSTDIDTVAAQYPRTLGLEMWPSILAAPGSTLVLTNMLFYSYPHFNCSENTLRQIMLSQSSVLGGSDNVGYDIDSKIMWTKGTHDLPLTVQSGSSENLGAMTLIVNNTAWGCLDPPGTALDANGSPVDAAGNYVTPPVLAGSVGTAPVEGGSSSSSSSSSSLSAGAIAGIVVGALAALAVVGILLWMLIQRKRRRSGWYSPTLLPQNSLFMQDHHPSSQSSPKTTTTSTVGLKSEFSQKLSLSPASTATTELVASSSTTKEAVEELNRRYEELAVFSALRIRFGSLDGLEIGHLIGRGAYGRIYKGSVRGLPVAVKVLDISISPGEEPTPENPCTAMSEAVLLTALAHPNIVRVFRVATIKLQDISSSPGSRRRSTSSNPSGTAASRADKEDAMIDAETGFNHRRFNDEQQQQQQEEEEEEQQEQQEQQEEEEEEPTTPDGSSPTSRSSVFNFTGPGYYEVWLVMEFCEKGSLEQAIHRKKFRTLSSIVKILIDVAQGMEYLHTGTHCVLHGDLKPANILLKSGSEPGTVVAVVADFGLSHMIAANDKKQSVTRSPGRGTAQFMAPELLSCGRLTRAADVWAFGIVMCELWTGENVFENQNLAQIYFSMVQEGHVPTAPEDCPPKYSEIIRNCLSKRPEERWSFTRILEELRKIKI